MGVTVNYTLSLPTLRDAIQTAYDLYASSGIVPREILVEDGTMVFFDRDDARKLLKGLLTQNEYFIFHKKAPM